MNAFRWGYGAGLWLALTTVVLNAGYGQEENNQIDVQQDAGGGPQDAPTRVTAEQLNAQIEVLKEVAARTGNSCMTAKYIAVSDEGVRELFLQKLEEGHVFNRMYCLNGPSIPEKKYVVFDFDCRPGTLCFIKPAFLVVIDSIGRRVESIVDPYLPSELALAAGTSRDREPSPVDTLGERTHLTLSNHTLRDIHIQVTGDVHTGNWGPNQVNHGEAPTVKSEKIDFGKDATYHIMVWTNAGGQPGDLITEFDAKVRYNIAGNSDILNFAIVDIGDETFLEVISTRLVARIAIALWLGQCCVLTAN